MESKPSARSEIKSKFLEPWFRPIFKPIRDTKTGISFIDILFALVIGQVLLEVRWPSLYPVITTGHASMLVAAFVTIASWIGYNNSHNKPQYRIQFINWPLIQFFIDISLVFFYWLMVIAAEDDGHDGSSPAVLAKLLLFIFSLYILWDITSWRISKYESESSQSARRRIHRFLITLGSTVLSAVAWWVASTIEMTARAEYWIDSALILISLGFRFAKDWQSRKQEV